MLLKAGTYRFNDVLSGVPNIEVGATGSIDIAFNYECNGSNFTLMRFLTQDNLWIAIYQISSSVEPIYVYCNEAVEGYYIKGWQDTTYQEHTIPEQEVDDTFGTWYIANTNYNEVNPTEDKEYIEKSSWYKSVADAIRNKKGTTDPILRDDFASEISSITGGGETPYYDGTVIIEKAESVLGLRRFKDTMTPIETDYDLYGGVSSNELSDNLFNAFGFSTEQSIETPNEIIVATVQFTCLLKVPQAPNNCMWVRVSANGDVTEGVYYEGLGNPTLDDFLNTLDNRTIDINYTANSTVDEWLLANTEGVSV